MVFRKHRQDKVEPSYCFFVNQARAWFLKIDLVRIIGMRVCMCVCVCVSAPETVNNQWHDVT